MAQHTQSPGKDSPPIGSWLSTFGDIFIGLDDAAVIRRVVGSIDFPTDLDMLQAQGMAWHDFVEHLASEDAKPGLRHLWLAIAKQHVAPAYWPTVVPFKPGIVARFRAVDSDPNICYVCHLAPAAPPNLDALIGSQTLGITQHLVQLCQNVFRGVHGPLTDSQVNALRGILTIAETLNHLLHDLRTAIIAPTRTAPLPYPLAELFTFTISDFTGIRRVATHELGLTATLTPDIMVYGYRPIRDIMRQLLETLLGNILTRSAIVITNTVDKPDAVQVTVTYQTQEPALRTTQRINPIPLLDAERFQITSTLHYLITTMQSYVAPVNGQVWAAPVPGRDDTMHVCVSLPRWQDKTTHTTEENSAIPPSDKELTGGTTN